ALEHVDYLRDYWTTDNLWKSWSDYGRKVAASLLGCEMEGVIPTTNHLESFNGVLKTIRVDILIQVLITHILPSIFQERRLYQEQEQRIATQVSLLPGGANLLRNRSMGKQIPKIAYLQPDALRDQRAEALLAAGQVGVPEFHQATNTLVFTCLSSEALDIESAPVKYTISLCFDGVATCICADIEKHGGACKHIRGSLLLLDRLRAGGINFPVIPVPTTLTEAHALQTKTAIKRAEQPATLGPRPTVQAAAAVADLLREDGFPVAAAADDENESEGEVEEEEGSDVDTDASSDSGEEADEADDLKENERASVNVAALGEQALARTIHELDEMGPRMGDLAEFLKRKSGPLSATEQKCLSRGRGHLAAMLAEIDRVLFSGSNPVPMQRPAESQDASQNTRKRGPNRTLHAPSPERAQRRHQSYSVLKGDGVAWNRRGQRVRREATACSGVGKRESSATHAQTNASRGRGSGGGGRVGVDCNYHPRASQRNMSSLGLISSNLRDEKFQVHQHVDAHVKASSSLEVSVSQRLKLLQAPLQLQVALKPSEQAALKPQATLKPFQRASIISRPLSLQQPQPHTSSLPDPTPRLLIQSGYKTPCDPPKYSHTCRLRATLRSLSPRRNVPGRASVV
ncbi:hypothetical protein B0H14DRAFT_3646774, partial [Mycena olivaceomarginata]